jgi:hypothetical protein
MKSRYLNSVVFTVAMIFSAGVQAQFDDLYFVAERDFSWKSDNSDIQTKENSSGVTDFNQEEQLADSYEDYDYGFSNRIRRFHHSGGNVRYHSFNTWFDTYDYDPFFDSNPDINIWLGSPVYNYSPWLITRSWRRPNFYNSWYMNTCYNNWGWNSWPYYQPFGGYAGWNSPFWHTHTYYPYGWNHPYHWNNWNNHHGWSGGNWSGGWSGNNNSDNTSRYFGSRKGGSLTSSTKGRDGTSKRGGVTEPVGLTPEPSTTNFQKDGAQDQNTLNQGSSGSRSFTWRQQKSDFGKTNSGSSNHSEEVNEDNKPIYDRGTSRTQEKPARTQQGSKESEIRNSGSSRNSGSWGRNENNQSRPQRESNDGFQNQDRGSRNGFDSGDFRSPSGNNQSRPSGSMRSGNDSSSGSSGGSQRSGSRRGGR